MISSLPAGQPNPSVPTFVLIPASLDRQNNRNGSHVDTGRDETPEMKNGIPGNLVTIL
jgi:hypothetical protein